MVINPKDPVLQLSEIINSRLLSIEIIRTEYFFTKVRCLTLHHDILLHKLQNWGTCGSTQNPFESYLKDRTKILILNNVNDVRNPWSSTVNGLVSSPILFLVCINSLLKLNIPYCNIGALISKWYLFDLLCWYVVWLCRSANKGLLIAKS